MAVEKVGMEGMIDYLSFLLQSRFSRDVSQIYYGDIGVYLPSSFGGSRKSQKAIIAIQPEEDELIEESRVAITENHNLVVSIVVLVNITPFFEANPQEAYGERMLTRIATDIAKFLTQEEHVNLGGRVEFSKVGSITWNWAIKGDQAIRAAAVNYQARVRVNRMIE